MDARQKVKPFPAAVAAAPRPPVQPVRVNALPVTQSGRGPQCYDCQQWGHKRAQCPARVGKKGFARNPIPAPNPAFANQRRNPPKAAAPGPPKSVKVNYVQVCDEAEEQANVYAALDPSGRNHQYSILEVQGDYKGKPLTFLIDSRSLHSFMSSITTKHLNIEAKPTGKKLRATLDNGASILTEEQVVEIPLQLEKNQTSQVFRIIRSPLCASY